LHLVGILFPHINDDARSKSHQNWYTIEPALLSTGLRKYRTQKSYFCFGPSSVLNWPYVKYIEGGGGPSNTTVIILNNDVKSYIRATCFDSTESSSDPRVSYPYTERTTRGPEDDSVESKHVALI